MLQGTRVDVLTDAQKPEGGWIPGTYWVVQRGELRELWFIDPTGHIGRVGAGHHTFTEHEDGTVTVNPSIVATVADHGHDWHGWLERGVWRDA